METRMKLLGDILYYIILILGLAASFLDAADGMQARKNRRKGKK